MIGFVPFAARAKTPSINWTPRSESSVWAVCFLSYIMNFWYCKKRMLVFLRKKLLKSALGTTVIAAVTLCSEGVAQSETASSVKNTPAVAFSNSYFKGTKVEREAQVRWMAFLLGVDCDFCHNKDLTVFTKEGETSKGMLKASVALGVDCNYCHKDRNHFRENEQMAKRMFEFCDIMGTECSFCHAGKDKLNEKGERAKTAFLVRNWATEGNKPCLECHIEKQQFALNGFGRQVLNTMKGF